MTNAQKPNNFDYESAKAMTSSSLETGKILEYSMKKEADCDVQFTCIIVPRLAFLLAHNFCGFKIRKFLLQYIQFLTTNGK